MDFWDNLSTRRILGVQAEPLQVGFGKAGWGWVEIIETEIYIYMYIIFYIYIYYIMKIIIYKFLERKMFSIVNKSG